MKLQMSLFIIIQKLYKFQSALDPCAVSSFLDILLLKKKLQKILLYFFYSIFLSQKPSLLIWFPG